MSNRKFLAAGIAIALVASLLIGVMIGFFGRRTKSFFEEADSSISQKLLDEIKPSSIREHLRNLTARPHLAGTPADLRQAKEIESFWKNDVGMDQVDVVPYDVLLSYPDQDNPNVVNLLDDSGNVLYQTQLFEKVLSQDQDQPDVVPPFNAYSPAGDVTGELVYVNYGRVEDFDWLEKNTNINLTGKIAIARYGKIFRGNKAINAHKQGAAGLIMFSDPDDYAIKGSNRVYPDTWWLPPTGVQRGGTQLDKGDPLTPMYPSIESAYRIPESEAAIPKIPLTPISYGDAFNLLSRMTGDDTPQDWQGGLNFTYKLGPGIRARMKVSTKNVRATTYNVIGFLRGHVEPDRYVILGNHRDAWVFGAIDPSSGTAPMMELSRVFGKLVKEGWKPRRSIVFASWGAEEYGMVGSKEWVENYIKVLSERTVAYLNVDSGLTGNFSLRAKSTPLMTSVLYESTKKVPNPDPREVAEGRKTVYDTWVHRIPKKDKYGKPTNVPHITTIGSGSDYHAFVQQAGVPSLDIRYTFDRKLGLSSYPLYHSVYETFHLVDTIMDKDYKFITATAQVWGELARSLADELVLPFDVTYYSSALEDFTAELLDGYGENMKTHGLQSGIDYLNKAVSNFKSTCGVFVERLSALDKTNPMAVRMVNDQLMQLERAFIDPAGLPGRPAIRHVLLAPNQHNTYAGSGFPGLTDLMYKIDESDKATAQWERVKRYLSVVVYTIDSAASTLRDVTNIHGG